MIIKKAESMIRLRRPAVLFALFFIFSAFLCAKVHFVVSVICAILMAGAALVLSFLSKNRQCIVCILLAFCLIYPSFYMSFGISRAHNTTLDKNPSSFSRAIVEDKSVSYNKTVLYTSLLSDNKKEAVTKVVIVYDEVITPEIYDVVEFSGIPFSFLDNESVKFYTDDFPTKEKALSKGCYVGIYANNVASLGRLEKDQQNILHRYYFYINDNLKKVLENFGGVDTFSYAAALLTGERSHLSQSTYDNFINSGLIAILCISGLHVVITSAFLDFFLKKLRLSTKLSTIILMLFLFFIMVITGFRGSVMRAAIMSMIFLISKLSHTHYDSFSVLAVSFLVISLANPFCIFDNSTILSFLAMTGLIFAQTAKDRFFDDNSNIFYKIKTTINTSIYAQTFAAVPVILMFGGISLISPISNLAVSVFFPTLMYFLVLCAFICFLPTPILSVVAVIPKILIYLLDLCSKIFSSIPFSYASFALPSFAIYLFAALFLIFLISVAFFEKRTVVFSGFCNLIFTLSVVILLFILSLIIGS